MILKKMATSSLLESINSRVSINNADSFSAIKGSEIEKENYINSLTESYEEAFGSEYDNLGAIGRELLKEDVEIAKQVMANSMDNTKNEYFNETADMRYLTASVVSTLRKPMEANMFRIFDNHAAETSLITMEFRQDTLTNSENDTVDSFSAFDTMDFLNTVEKPIAVGTTGIEPHQRNVDLLSGFNKAIHRIDNNIRITGIEYHTAGGTPVAADKIRPKKGSNPYFDSKLGLADMSYEVETSPGTYVIVNINAKVDFGKGILETLTTDSPYDTGAQSGVKKVFFDIRLAHDAHQNAISISTKNRFTTVPIPTSPHFEVAESIETLHDMKSNESGLKGADVISILSEKMVSLFANKEDLILYNMLNDPKTKSSIYKMNYDYETPATYATGSPFEWIKLNFINLVDLVCTEMKKEYHIKNAIFKIAVSPIMLRIIDNGYALGTEESNNTLLNYSISAKTAANTLIFISSERYDDTAQINMILTDKENPIVKTYDYYKYQSFLTDALQSSKNSTRKAITFSERNLPLITEPVGCHVKIDNLPHKVSAGNRFYKNA